MLLTISRSRYCYCLLLKLLKVCSKNTHYPQFIDFSSPESLREEFVDVSHWDETRGPFYIFDRETRLNGSGSVYPDGVLFPNAFSVSGFPRLRKLSHYIETFINTSSQTSKQRILRYRDLRDNSTLARRSQRTILSSS